MSRIERAVDWAVGVVSPRRAALRGHFRRMDQDEEYRDVVFAALNARGYRAVGSKNATGWMQSSKSADGEIVSDLPALISNSRELNRDDPIASGLTKTFVNNVIGTGMVPQGRTEKSHRNKAMEAVWREYKDSLARADDMTCAEAQRMWMSKALEDGGLFVKRAKTKSTDPVWVESIEKDRVATPTDSKPPQGGSIRDGVVKDKFSIPIAYKVAKNHPGDSFSLGAKESDFITVPKSEMLHIRFANRPGQTHGVPVFHAVLQDLRDLDLLMLAALKRAQISACLAVFIKTNKSIPDLLDVTAQKYGYQLDQAIEPGMIFKLYPDEEVQTLVPNFPTPDLVPFVIMLCRRIGAALGVSWQIVLKDFSGSTYSSARTDLLESRQVYVILQKWFIEKLMTPLWLWVMEDAILRGDPRMTRARVNMDDARMVYWIPQGWRWIDPKTEAQAIALMRELRVTTLRDVCASQGQDWEDTLRQGLEEEAKEEEIRKELGLPSRYEIDAMKKSLPVKEEDKPDEEDEPKEESEEDEDSDEEEGEDEEKADK